MRKNGHTIEKPRTMLTSTVVANNWKNTWAQIGRPDTHPDLLKTYKRIYYAGHQHMLQSLMEHADLDETDELTQDDLHKIDAVMHELNAFFVEVAAGRQ